MTALTGKEEGALGAVPVGVSGSWTSTESAPEPVTIGDALISTAPPPRDPQFAVKMSVDGGEPHERLTESVLVELLQVSDVALVDQDISACQHRLLGGIAGGGLALDECDQLAQVGGAVV